jgi:RNase P protein component
MLLCMYILLRVEKRNKGVGKKVIFIKIVARNLRRRKLRHISESMLQRGHRAQSLTLIQTKLYSCSDVDNKTLRQNPLNSALEVRH